MSRKHTIEFFRQLAEEKGGECLSDTYIDQKTELSWKCGVCGHVWNAKPANIKGSRNKPGTWCPPCGSRKVAKARMRPIEDLQCLAESHGGICASSENLGSNVKHRWRCCYYPSHPEFLMIPNAVQQGQWCSKCRGCAKPTFEERNELARERAGNPLAKCVSTHYENSTSILEWWCGVEGHPIVSHAYRSIKYEQVFWCKLCKKAKSCSKKYNHDLLIRLAKHCGGSLLSEEEYRNTKQKHTWKCSDGHEFSRSLDNILSARSFCPYCFQRGGMREQYIRELFFFMFNAPFERTRQLPWLVNQRGNRMELDGYNPDLAIAFEHNGQQHYELDGYFTTHQDQLTKRYADDECKIQLCKEKNVVLITIPFSVSLKEIQSYVLSELAKIKIEPPNIETFPLGIRHVKMLKKLQDHAASLGGCLLSDKYLGSDVKHTWKCKNPEHPSFLLSPSSAISTGHWCDRCDDERRSESYKISEEELQALAQRYHCELVPDGLETGTKWASNNKANFLCQSCGRHVTRTIQQLKNGLICFCSTKKIRIDRSRIQEVLASTSIDIVEPNEILGGKTMVTLGCRKCEHQWSLKATYVMNATVKCEKCTPRRNKPLTIEKARALGEKHGFILRSDTLVNGQTTLHYECKKCGIGIDKCYRQMRGVRQCPHCSNKEAASRLGLN